MPIKELPKSVSSKIAAGEVVERPASVVKELIENSLDAGATDIAIRVEDAGRTLIEVEDNGEGIPSQDALLAVRRYATSKISSFEDLDHIQSLGFRGEALASIAAVSRFTLETRYHTEAHGLNLVFEGGIETDKTRAGRNSGTRVRVENLFYNVPARFKFQKKDITEKRLISEIVTRYGLYYSRVRFSLTMDNRKVMTTYGRGQRREILSEIYNLDTARRLLDIDFSNDDIQAQGFASPTSLTRANRKEIIFFINGRLVADSALTSAVLRAYHGFLMVGRFPIAILFLSVQPQDIDVNVHPTKAEIRFRDQSKVFSAVHGAVRKVISAYSPVPAFSPGIWNSAGAPSSLVDPAWKFAGQEFRNVGLETSVAHPEPSAPGLIEKVPLLRLIGQLGRLYIAAEGPDGLYLIDQHSAHERILYEQMVNSRTGKAASQLLLDPAVVHLNQSLVEIFESRLEILTSIGFRASIFGPDSIRIEAIPSIIQHLDPEEALLAALEADEEDRNLVEQRVDQQIKSRICKRAAVKGGQVLSIPEQEKLLRELENCESPRTCPHGRPTMIHLSVDLLARQFGRLGSR